MLAEMAEAEPKRITAAINVIWLIHQAFPEIINNMLGLAKGRIGEILK